jgi:hypothetical protein
MASIACRTMTFWIDGRLVDASSPRRSARRRIAETAYG